MLRVSFRSVSLWRVDDDHETRQAGDGDSVSSKRYVDISETFSSFQKTVLLWSFNKFCYCWSPAQRRAREKKETWKWKIFMFLRYCLYCESAERHRKHSSIMKVNFTNPLKTPETNTSPTTSQQFLLSKTLFGGFFFLSHEILDRPTNLKYCSRLIPPRETQLVVEKLFSKTAKDCKNWTATIRATSRAAASLKLIRLLKWIQLLELTANTLLHVYWSPWQQTGVNRRKLSVRA